MPNKSRWWPEAFLVVILAEIFTIAGTLTFLTSSETGQWAEYVPVSIALLVDSILMFSWSFYQLLVVYPNEEMEKFH